MRRHGLRARIRQQRRLFQRLATRHALARRGHAGVRMLEAIGEWSDERPDSVRFVPPLADIVAVTMPRVVDAPKEIADSMFVSDATSSAVTLPPPPQDAAVEARTEARPQRQTVGSQSSADARGEPTAPAAAPAVASNVARRLARSDVAVEAQSSGAPNEPATTLEPPEPVRPDSPVAATASTSARGELPRTSTASAPNATEVSAADAAHAPAAPASAPHGSEHDTVVQRALAALRRSGELPPTPRTKAEPPRDAAGVTSTRSARSAPDLVRDRTSLQAGPVDAREVLAAPEQPADAASIVVTPSRDSITSLVAERADAAPGETRAEATTATSGPTAPPPTAPTSSPTAAVEPTSTGRIDERRQARRPAHLVTNRGATASEPDATTAPNAPPTPARPAGSGGASDTPGQFQFTDFGRTPQEWRQLLIEAMKPPTARPARPGHAPRVETPLSGARGAQVDEARAATPVETKAPAPTPASTAVPPLTPTRTPTAPAIAEPRGRSAGVRRVPPAVPSTARDVSRSGSDRVPAPAPRRVRHAAEPPRPDESVSEAGSDTSTTETSMPAAPAPGAASPNAPRLREPALPGSVLDAPAAAAGSALTQKPSPATAAHEQPDMFDRDAHLAAPVPIDQSGAVPAAVDIRTAAPHTATDISESTDEEADVRPRTPQPSVASTATGAASAAPRGARVPEPLAPSARRFLQPLVGIDPDTVRIHRDEHAARIAAAHNADAVAIGDDIELGAGHDERDPATIALVAHELTHVARARAHRFVPPVARGSWSPSARGATSVWGMDATSASVAPSPADEETVARVAEARVRDAAAHERAVAVTTVVESDVARRVPEVGRRATAHRRASMSTEAAGDVATPNVAVPDDSTRGSEDPWGGLPAPWEPLPAFLSDRRQHVVPRAEMPESSDAPNGRSTADAAPVAVQRAERGVGHAGEEPAHAEPPTSADAGGPDLDALARQVYDVLRRRLAAERRRGA